MTFPPGSVVAFDRGYNNYRWHNTLSEQGIFFVSRLRRNAKYRVVERRIVPKNGDVTSDQTIEYTAARKDGNPLKPIRRIGYRDPITGKHYVFISNQFRWSASTIADIYKQRWQVELFFKWIKQNLQIKAFLGNTEKRCDDADHGRALRLPPARLPQVPFTMAAKSSTDHPPLAAQFVC